MSRLVRPAGLPWGLTVLTLAVALLSASPASAKPVGPKKGPKSGFKVCPLVSGGALKKAEIVGACEETKRTKTSGLRIYPARWGANGDMHHVLLVTVSKFLGPAAGFAQNNFRHEVIASGNKVNVGTVGSVQAETYNGGNALPIPPATVRLKAELLFIAGGYDVTALLLNDDPAVDESQIEAELVGIGKSIAAKL